MSQGILTILIENFKDFPRLYYKTESILWNAVLKHLQKKWFVWYKIKDVFNDTKPFDYLVFNKKRMFWLELKVTKYNTIESLFEPHQLLLIKTFDNIYGFVYNNKTKKIYLLNKDQWITL